jgi:uncharacterized protein YrrD
MPDEGRPIAYEVLESDVPVYAVQGERIGTVDHVIAAPELDIFHGIVVRAGDRRVFVAADDIETLHERGVDLRISADAAAALPDADPEHTAELAPKPSSWRRFVDGVFGGGS